MLGFLKNLFKIRKRPAYRSLSLEEKRKVAQLKKEGLVPRQIAESIGRATSTINKLLRTTGAPRIRRKGVSTAVADEIAKRYSAGEKSETLQDEYNISPGSLYLILHKRQVKLRGQPKKSSASPLELAYREYKKGMKVSLVARKYKIKAQAIYNYGYKVTKKTKE